VERGLQEIVDALSLNLGRPVLIDDTELRPLAYSSQFGELDDVRTASILGRLAPDAARVALFEEGIRAAVDEVHIPARPEIGMRARVCVPVIGGGRRLGYLWLFEEPPVSPEELRLARAAAAEAAALVRAAAGRRAAERRP
jgi:GAF domain-containing protein